MTVFKKSTVERQGEIERLAKSRDMAAHEVRFRMRAVEDAQEGLRSAQRAAGAAGSEWMRAVIREYGETRGEEIIAAFYERCETGEGGQDGIVPAPGVAPLTGPSGAGQSGGCATSPVHGG